MVILCTKSIFLLLLSDLKAYYFYVPPLLVMDRFHFTEIRSQIAQLKPPHRDLIVIPLKIKASAALLFPKRLQFQCQVLDV